MDIPKSYYVYEFAYPEEMPELAGIVFYVGKGTSLSRMNDHFREAAREDCDCAKCKAIRSIWVAGRAVVRNIVFTSTDETATLKEESDRIIRHHSPHLTNIKLPQELILANKQTQALETNEPDRRSEMVFSIDHDTFITREEMQKHLEKNYPGGGLRLSSPLIERWALEEDEAAYYDLSTSRITLEMGTGQRVNIEQPVRKRKQVQGNDPEASLRALEELQREIDGPPGLYKLLIHKDEYGDVYFGG